MAESNAETLLFDEIASAQVAELAVEFGLQLTRDTPWTNGFRTISWGAGERRVRLSYNALAGLASLTIVADPSIVAACMQRFDSIGPEAALDTTRTDLVRSNFELAAWVDSGADAAEAALTLLCARLSHADKMVRWSACRLARWYVEPSVLAAFERAVASQPDLAPEIEFVRERVQAHQEGTFWDTPTDSWYVLIDRGRAGVESGQFARVEHAAEMLLADAPYHAEGLLLRAYAYEAAGNVALGLGLAGASLLAQETDPESSFHTPKLLSETEEAVERLKVAVTTVALDEELFDAEMERWFGIWRDSYHTETTTGFARALVDVTHPALFSLIAGRWDNDPELLARAQSLAPDSAAANVALGHALAAEDPARSGRLLETALGLVDAPEKSDLARRLDAHDHGRSATTRVSILEGLARREYDAQRWDEAARLAGQLVAEEQTNTAGWQMWANALTFALRHEEAIDAYGQALGWLEAEMNDPEAIHLGGDPRPGMRFNLSCVQAILGRREEALDSLRMAVRDAEKYAEMAAQDDYWSKYIDDPEFQAIVSFDARSLIMAAELEREHVEDLATRALGLSHSGDVDGALSCAERAIELAEIAGFDDLLVRGLAAQGRTVAFHDNPHVGLESLERAIAVVERCEIGPSLAATTWHDYGAVLHAARYYDRAGEAYRTSLAARTAIHGVDHPVLAKCFGDLARLAKDIGDDGEADRLMARGTDLLDAYFAAGDFADRTTHADALIDRASLWSNRAHIALSVNDFVGSIPLLTRAVEALEEVARAGYHAGGFDSRTSEFVTFVLNSGADAPTTQAARELATRLDDLVLDPEPVVRREQQFWRRLRAFVRQMAGQGVSGEVLAEAFRIALRGEVLPQVVRELPELAGLADGFAQRAARIPAFLVTSALALEMAMTDGNLDGALAQLEGICVAHAFDELEGNG